MLRDFRQGKMSISAATKAMHYFCHKVDMTLISKFYKVAPVNRDIFIILLFTNLSHVMRVN